ncbi:hypothetical protein GOP47_0028156 [Adiantum capillus-veneris]|nr:hypothetical protein GOP47_0028156 [Adiantum capillus-veneris]
MRTRRASYSTSSDGITFVIKPKLPAQKRRKLLSSKIASPLSPAPAVSPTSTSSSSFDRLHDELLVSIMASLSASATSPADLINAMLTCKRFCAAGAHPLVLSNASASALAVKAQSWSEGAYRFLWQCERSGNVEATYTLGMIRFYCFSEREKGAALMAHAALKPHAPALHSLAIIQFNGSGGSRKDKNLKNGASLCAKAASHGHVDAIRELGHCLQDGYGMPKNVAEGRRLLLEANAREAAAAVAASPRAFVETALHLAAHSTRAARCVHQQALYRSAISKVEVLDNREMNSIGHGHPLMRLLQGGGCSLLSDFGCNVPPPKLHIANQFLVDWFSLHPPQQGLRLCSHANCGRPETRRHEFRRCSACGKTGKTEKKMMPKTMTMRQMMGRTHEEKGEESVFSQAWVHTRVWIEGGVELSDAHHVSIQNTKPEALVSCWHVSGGIGLRCFDNSEHS